MSLLGRQAREIPYDDSEPVLTPDPHDPNHWTYSQPAPPLLRVRLERGMRGAYGYEITYEGTDGPKVLAMLRVVDAALRAEYCRE